ncbi:hypothetical protein GSY74_01660 [Sulfurovum sp. bin170]|uniref:hypothetical protein n=1 Tax=Sulfurovum sp. bin170 TaxID=2695268 RepID=UPI0013DF0116|nr:hypothetical protein [Sulfurovum sp. bin170]NEW59977.1 hypothetical protein [Sulfurovum sp. bin170]
MKFSELLGKEGLTSVSERTNISIEILESLVDNNFEDLTRVKAMGFLSILKREYDMPLDDLESSIKNYFEEHSDNDNQPILLSADRTKRDSGFLKWLIIFILLGGLWYLYNSDKLGGNLSNTENRENELKDSEVLQSSVNEEDAKESVVIKDAENEDEIKVEIQTTETTQVTEEKSIDENESNNSVAAESSTVIESIEDKVEENITVSLNSAEDNKEIESNKTTTEKSIAEETTDEIVDEAIETNVETASDNIIVEGEEKAEIIYNVTVNPRVNLWFGFINLDTKGRKEFITTESTPIDVGEQRWVLITGHGRLSVASDLETLEINDSSKHYFYIDSNEMREISRSEFKALNDGKGW